MSSIVENYTIYLDSKLTKKIKHSAVDIVTYLHDNNSNVDFVHKMYDILCELDTENNDCIYNILDDLDTLNDRTTFQLNPAINQPVHDEIIKRRNGNNNSAKYYNTEFTCKKCKHSNTTIVFVNKHLGSDEASSLKITCVNCNNEWCF